MGTPHSVRSLPKCKQKQESPHTANSGHNTDPDACRGLGAVRLLLMGDVCTTHGPTAAPTRARRRQPRSSNGADVAGHPTRQKDARDPDALQGPRG